VESLFPLISFRGASSDTKRGGNKRNGAFGQSKRAHDITSVVMRGPLDPYIHARLPDRYLSCIRARFFGLALARACTHACTRVRSACKPRENDVLSILLAPRRATTWCERGRRRRRNAERDKFLHFSVRVLLFGNNCVLLIYNILTTNILCV